ncbi:methionine ABC transporter ATP-binding protein [Desulfotomaculum copahuensis]|uniref:Methionine ABC transporter ATP-binding protein n=1 Tax=Desulfotomaculum copahuensis TaxID=1838280 RepID=A0A1B7LFD2_9FIRM|nr:methionine ABC transporter ATP-binding protein [Desulfotomaculum copahuensis]OAT82328.1 methionine ABC transporter ATP-binding protein [Desulfotomaculum copahuensis]
MATVKIESLSKVYSTRDGSQIQALQDINLDIPDGEIFGIIGLSGAGKSTLIRCINMLERPTTGRVIVDGRDLTALPSKELRHARRQIGMIFQQFNLLSSRTVAGNVAFPLEIAGIPRTAVRQRVNNLLDMVGLAEKADVYPAELSGGQKQRVGIARALASEPRLLLCDEPTSALDPQTTGSILHLLQEINKKLDLTIIIITHEMQVIKEICDRVAVIDQSRIVEAGSVLDIFTAPQTKTAREFVKSVLNTAIPEEVRQNHRPPETGESRLVRISFIGRSAGQPVISTMIKEFGVHANILFGKIDHIKSTPFGTLTLELIGPPADIEAAVGFLRRQQLNIEVLSENE